MKQYPSLRVVFLSEDMRAKDSNIRKGCVWERVCVCSNNMRGMNLCKLKFQTSSRLIWALQVRRSLILSVHTLSMGSIRAFSTLTHFMWLQLHMRHCSFWHQSSERAEKCLSCPLRYEGDSVLRRQAHHTSTFTSKEIFSPGFPQKIKRNFLYNACLCMFGGSSFSKGLWGILHGDSNSTLAGGTLVHGSVACSLEPQLNLRLA